MKELSFDIISPETNPAGNPGREGMHQNRQAREPLERTETRTRSEQACQRGTRQWTRVQL